MGRRVGNKIILIFSIIIGLLFFTSCDDELLLVIEQEVSHGKGGAPIFSLTYNAQDITDSETGINICSKKINTNNDITFTITNTGGNDLLLSGSPVVQISGSSAFTINTQPASLIIPEQSSDFIVRFTPDSEISFNSTITIATNDPNNSTYTFSITGSGTDSSVLISEGSTTLVNNDDVYMGKINLSTDLETDFTIQNLGNASLTVSEISITGNESVFSISTDSLPITISSNSSNTFSISYNNSEMGYNETVLNITTDNTDSLSTTLNIGASSGIWSEFEIKNGTSSSGARTGYSVDVISSGSDFFGATGMFSALSYRGDMKPYTNIGGNQTSWNGNEAVSDPTSYIDASDWYGYSVAMTDSISPGNPHIIVGTPYATTDGFSSGMAVVMLRSWGGGGSAGTYRNWVHISRLQPSDGAASDLFGHSVDVKGDRAIIGAKNHNDTGAVYIYEYASSYWGVDSGTYQLREENIKLTATDSANWDYYGDSVSIDGDYAVVGAPGEDDNYGAAYVLYRNSGIWEQQDKITANITLSTGSDFGEAVDINGDYIIVGADYYRNGTIYSGAAFIFKRNGTDWEQTAQLIPEDGINYAYFGQSVAISDKYAVVGAFQDNDTGSHDNSGSIYIYEKRGEDWELIEKLTSSEISEDAYFGRSVSIEENFILVGSDGKNSNDGAVYIIKCE